MLGVSGEKKIFVNLASKAKRRYHLLTRDVQYERYRKHMEVSVEGINLFCTWIQAQLWCFNTAERQLRI